jgi:hypothetical protein
MMGPFVLIIVNDPVEKVFELGDVFEFMFEQIPVFDNLILNLNDGI